MDGWRVFLCAALILAWPCVSEGLTRSGTVGDVGYTVYAPDWTWQDREVNILVVLRSTTGSPREATVSLVLPPDKAGDFAYGGEAVIRETLEDSTPVRAAFVGIKPLSGVPRQTYPLEVRIHTAGGETHIDYPLRTIRGAAVSPGKWAVLLPVAVALAWCVVMGIALHRLSPTRRWWRVSGSVQMAESGEEWIHRTRA